MSTHRCAPGGDRRWNGPRELDETLTLHPRVPRGGLQLELVPIWSMTHKPCALWSSRNFPRAFAERADGPWQSPRQMRAPSSAMECSQRSPSPPPRKTSATSAACSNRAKLRREASEPIPRAHLLGLQPTTLRIAVRSPCCPPIHPIQPRRESATTLSAGLPDVMCSMCAANRSNAERLSLRYSARL
jgi:hypothetical protein